MSTKSEASLGQATECSMKHELGHLRKRWWWLLLLGFLLALCGIAAIVSSPITVLTTFVVVSILAVILMIAGVATIIGSFWAGKWGGFLVQLLVGILYVAASLVITERPLATPLVMTIFIAVSFMVIGVFRVLASLIVRFPQWGWAMLNGTITFLAGFIIFRHLPTDALWVIGLLVGVELLLNGWTWIMLALEIKDLSDEACS